MPNIENLKFTNLFSPSLKSGPVSQLTLQAGENIVFEK